MSHELKSILCRMTCIVGLVAAPSAAMAQTAQEIAGLSPTVFANEQQTQFSDQTWHSLRARGEKANQRNVALWRSIESREDWQRVRDGQLERLRKSLGGFPAVPVPLDVRVTGRIAGDGYRIQNLVYCTRPDIWVTANMYAPATSARPMPGILIVHSHHRPKTQEELQDMGMTWARKGCHVLVIDQLGHGERADHPFQSDQAYAKKDPDYRWWRQDYYYRFDLDTKLSLVGESLMGRMVWDLMRGVDLLIATPNVDAKQIVLLGAVAGGGDPAAVTAALDERIAAVVPFNFGGPQPETRFPLPDDADMRFNYLGSASWESTRNLRRTAIDGFFHWSIVGSLAPRRLVYAHEFSWDKKHDPVWKRLNKIYSFYGATDKLDYTLGRGSVKGSAPEATHCTNIGPYHRRRIHTAFRRWFNINVTESDEYSQPVEAAALSSMTDEVRRELRPKKLFETLTDVGLSEVVGARLRLANKSPEDQRAVLQTDWRQLLGDIDPRDGVQEISLTSELTADKSIVVQRVVLQTEPKIVVPLILLYSNQDKREPSRVVVAVAQSGRKQFLRQRSQAIAELLSQGAVVCIPDVRGAGEPRGSRGELGSSSYYALLFETPMLGYRLRDLRAVMKYLRTRDDLAPRDFALWGDSFTPPNSEDTEFQVPKRVDDRPRFSEPLGGLLAMLGALYEDDVRSVYVHGGLSAYRDVLTGPYVFVPHDVVVPGVLTKGDISDLLASLAPCPVRLEGTVDGWNRLLTGDDVRAEFSLALEMYQNAPEAISFSQKRTKPAVWLSR